MAARAIRTILKQGRNHVVTFGSSLRRLARTSRRYVPGRAAILGMALIAAGCTSMGPTFPQTSHSYYVPQYRPPAGTGRESGGRVVTASWYGSEFAGHHTASGERFNPNEMTAASKTLPIGSRVRVTNPRNGKSVVVRINDRGPYVHGRSIDLSRKAAQKLGITHRGVARVKIKKLRTPPDSDRASL